MGRALRHFRKIFPVTILRYGKALTGEMKCLVKVQFSKRQYGKSYYAVIRERRPAYQTMFPKSFEDRESSCRFFSTIFSANSCPSRFDLQPKNVKPPVSRCKTVCGTPAAWVAIRIPREAETWCRGVCAPLSRETILPLKFLRAAQKKPLECWADHPVFQVISHPTVRPNSQAFCSAKCPGQGQSRRFDFCVG